MHALICAAAGLTVGLGAVGVANADVRPAGDALPTTLQFEVMEGLTGFTSARNWTQDRTVPAGETFEAAMLAQNTSSAFFIDDFPDNFVFFGGVQDGGANLVTGAATRLTGNQVGNTVRVAAYTLDSSDWLPAGVDPGDGDPLAAIRFDVGGFAAGTDSITYPGFSAADVVSVDVVLFVDGAAIFTGALPGGNLDLSTGLAGVAVVGGAAGAGIDEVQMVFNLNVPTPGAASVFGLAGLAAVRRRRR